MIVARINGCNTAEKREIKKTPSPISSRVTTSLVLESQRGRDIRWEKTSCEVD